MTDRQQSLLQQMLIKSKELKTFTFNNMVASFPDGKKRTISRYITGLIRNGNLIKQGQQYLFINDKPIKVKIGE